MHTILCALDGILDGKKRKTNKNCGGRNDFMYGRWRGADGLLENFFFEREEKSNNFLGNQFIYGHVEFSKKKVGGRENFLVA